MEDDEGCYQLSVLTNICVKVDLEYLDMLPPGDAEAVSNVKVTTGCYIDGDVGLYQNVPLE